MSFTPSEYNGDPNPPAPTINPLEQFNSGHLEAEQLRNALNTLHQRIQELESQQARQPVEQPAVPTVPLSSVTKPREPKASAPEHFRGERSKLKSFITQLNVCFTLEPSRFTSERSKILYASTQFRDKAMNWLRPQLEHYMAFENGEPQSPNLNFTTFKEFATHLQATFGDINEEATAERDLKAHRQTSSVAFYTSEFQRIVSILDWDEKALVFMYYTGLKDNIKDELSKMDKPTTLHDLIYHSMKIDARQYDRIRERQFEKRAGFQPRPFGTPSAPNARTPPHDPMDLSASFPSKNGSKPRGKLSEAERAYRRANNLCNYCGKPHHVVATCPLLMSQRSLAATSEDSNSAQPDSEASKTSENGQAQPNSPEN